MNKKEHSIKLNNSKVGDFYFHYQNADENYIFSKKIPGIRKWKNIENYNKFKNSLYRNVILYDHIILLECTDLVNNKLLNESDHEIIISNKRYYIIVKKVLDESIDLNITINQLDLQINKLSKDIKHLTNLYCKNKEIDKNKIINLLREMEDSIQLYNKYSKSINSNDYIENRIEHVDSSNGFRLLKIEKIMNIN